MAIFFTSDTHFGDHRTLNIHRRPFASAATMDATMVRNWNNAVSADDEVWHLGDFARSLKVATEILPALHGRKHLLRGNNDPTDLGALADWASVGDYAELKLDGHLFVLCHYAFRTWNGQHRKAINLHGHSHGRLKPLSRQVDVGVDCWGFQPVSLPRLLAPLARAKSS
jgi:calcineurin-like phosphoesterase family protein